jgi:hypothetical protein
MAQNKEIRDLLAAVRALRAARKEAADLRKRRQAREQAIEDAVHRATVGERSILAEAHAIVAGARNLSYGHPRDNHRRTAALWSAYLGVPISPRQVCMLNALQKISRDAHRAGRDNLVERAGGARNAELVDAPSGEGASSSATC